MKHSTLVVVAAITVTGALGAAPVAVAIDDGNAPGIENFSRIDKSVGFAGSPVGFGGATQSTAMPWLASEGFTTVINLRLASEDGVDVDGGRAAAETAGLNYVHLPFDPGDPQQATVDQFLTAAGDKEKQPVYIHCKSGTRAAALWMIGRVLEDGWEIDAAGEEAKAIAGDPDKAVALARAYLASQGNGDP